MLKVTRGDRLEHQRTLMDLILGILASGGGSSPSAMAIVMEDGVTESRPSIAPGNVDNVKLSRLELFKTTEKERHHQQLKHKANVNVKTISTTKDQMQVRVVSVVPSEFDIKAEQMAESDLKPARTIPLRMSRPKQPKAEVMMAHLVSSSSQDGQLDPKASTTNSSSPPPPMELKPLQNHFKYAYLDNEQQLSVIIANNLHQEQEDKLLDVLRQYKKAIGWKLSDLPGINPIILMHKILMEEEFK
ncbi:hypothetical protein CR513_36977, partial [Mucuna pruriens]